MKSLLEIRRALREILLVSVLCLLSLAAGAGALVLAEFGGPVWVFAVLLAWLLTFGLPTLVAVLLLAWFWPGPSFQAYLLSAVLLALLFQWSAVFGFRWGITRRRISPR